MLPAVLAVSEVRLIGDVLPVVTTCKPITCWLLEFGLTILLFAVVELEL